MWPFSALVTRLSSRDQLIPETRRAPVEARGNSRRGPAGPRPGSGRSRPTWHFTPALKHTARPDPVLSDQTPVSAATGAALACTRAIGPAGFGKGLHTTSAGGEDRRGLRGGGALQGAQRWARPAGEAGRTRPFERWTGWPGLRAGDPVSTGGARTGANRSRRAGPAQGRHHTRSIFGRLEWPLVARRQPVAPAPNRTGQIGSGLLT